MTVYENTNNEVIYIVDYVLYGMRKRIVFYTFSQFTNWQWAMSQLNDDDYTAFNVCGIQNNIVLGGGHSFLVDER